MELPRSRIPCQPGLQFRSRYPVDPRRVALHDLLPEEQLREVENLHDFAGILVFDKWACNTNGSKTIFSYEDHGSPGQQEWRYKARMIDQGFCFNVAEWNFPDAPLRGISRLCLRGRHRDGIFRPLARASGKTNDRARPGWFPARNSARMVHGRLRCAHAPCRAVAPPADPRARFDSGG